MPQPTLYRAALWATTPPPRRRPRAPVSRAHIWRGDVARVLARQRAANRARHADHPTPPRALSRTLHPHAPAPAPRTPPAPTPDRRGAPNPPQTAMLAPLRASVRALRTAAARPRRALHTPEERTLKRTVSAMFATPKGGPAPGKPRALRIDAPRLTVLLQRASPPRARSARRCASWRASTSWRR